MAPITPSREGAAPSRIARGGSFAVPVRRARGTSGLLGRGRGGSGPVDTDSGGRGEPGLLSRVGGDTGRDVDAGDAGLGDMGGGGVVEG